MFWVNLAMTMRLTHYTRGVCDSDALVSSCQWEVKRHNHRALGHARSNVGDSEVDLHRGTERVGSAGWRVNGHISRQLELRHLQTNVQTAACSAITARGFNELHQKFYLNCTPAHVSGVGPIKCAQGLDGLAKVLLLVLLLLFLQLLLPAMPQGPIGTMAAGCRHTYTALLHKQVRVRNLLVVRSQVDKPGATVGDARASGVSTGSFHRDWSFTFVVDYVAVRK
jgi:hypothetical protein